MDENDYLDLFEQSPALLLVLDTKFNIVTATDAYLKVTMTERKNIVGRNMFDVFPDNPSNKNSEAITNVKASLIQVLKSKVTDIMQIQKHDIRKPESEGGEFEERFWSPVNSPILDKNNNVKYIIHRVEDVTQNKELTSTNQKLRESYDFSKAIIATIHETMLVLKKDFKVKSASKSFYKKFLVTKEATKGKSIFELENGIWDIPEIHELLQTTATDKANVDDLEIKITFPHIGEKSMLVNANPIIKKNQDKQLLLFTIKDITEVRRLGFALQSKEKRVLEEQLDIEKKALKKIEDSEKRYNMMLMESPFAIAILKGKDMVVTLANASIKEIWGKGNNVEGKKFIDILPELKDLSFPLLLDEVYSTGIPFYGYELPVPLVRDGKIVNEYFNFVYQPYHEADKTVSGVTIIASDVTTQVSAKNELIEAKIKAEQKTKIAEEAVKSKQQFLSNMSHEIRTPMNAIIGFTNVVLKTDLDESQKEYINAIKESGDALIVLINDILDIAKVDAGKMTFEKTAFSLSNSIATMLHLFEAKIVEKNLELHHEYDATIPLNVIGDPMRLRQIILNLMSNAVKFTSKGKIAICLRLVDQDTEKVTIEFLITDTGIGIPKNRLADIFNNFEQATVGTSNSFGGTGLGLAITKQLVELQGGTITVNSEEGKGSDFSFVLTFDKIKSEVKAIKEEVKLFQEIPQETRTTGKVKVLVAEDIALNQLLIKIILLDFGYEIDMANNGKEAVEKLQKNTYDIILMDLQMPVMNGFEATRYIRNELNSNIPIIALTADVTSVDVEKCKAAGMNDYVSKPIDEKILYNKIIGCLKESNTIK
ncbi:PAS domain S-box-containing protein [Flavobacterium sp. CG_23.5]|uniref:PAS domain-containing hybrid sensor histidine kinase/response regulator n=1 Tax=Flavobacterium sp. CG_23.5 TaxID=2760708 RepID=UPI001AE1C17C|nr:ATP-binding protein [Flavobacterium sp. CG_23.5]MBP2283004.1 PAS domain S-box-containing protein [Flavobacterium sp. CG_23.5]